MTQNRLAVTEFNKILETPYGDVFRPAHLASRPHNAFLFAHGVSNDISNKTMILSSGKPLMAFLAPDGYSLYAAKGQISAYEQSERFDVCEPGSHYLDYRMLPVDDLSFVDMQEHTFSALSGMIGFDVVLLRQPCDLSELIECSGLVDGYEHLDLHCGRCRLDEPVSPKYFLPLNTTAYLIKKSEPVGWQSF
ncbi:Uncharacterised protein [BD1-7 clade bacterium]|uniref:Uncharacterized protein n=1 Tax=BD1-7 clade bacterium TaxID=2029982 RepID=A0A5S9QUR8_9GAMM|nr:Uncharacterised protein [BD1-7 clade bacterium]CAA0122731.1 Uncharacterised protein [BD1-7 clade bacterium]